MSPDRAEILRRAGNRIAMFPGLRPGQAVFYEAASVWPFEAELLAGGSHDCFYCDDKVAEFLTALEKLVTIGVTEDDDE